MISPGIKIMTFGLVAVPQSTALQRALLINPYSAVKKEHHHGHCPGPGQGTMVGSCEHGNEHLASIKAENLTSRATTIFIKTTYVLKENHCQYFF
jgi:hypothetical protein